MTASIKRFGLAARTGFVLVVVAAVVAGLPGPNAVPRAAAESSALEVLGELKSGCPDGTSTPGSDGMTLLHVDSEAQRLYTKLVCGGEHRLVIHDISAEVPTASRVSEPFDTKFRWVGNQTFVSPEAGRLYALGFGGVGSSQTADTGESFIEVYDTETLEKVATWVAKDTTPGFFPMGMAHDPDRGRVYLLGELGHRGTYELLNQVRTRGNPPQAAIAAVDDSSGELIWLNRLDGCETPMNSEFQGGILELSAVRPMLYAFCVGAGSVGAAVGQGGLLRLDISEQGDADGVVVDFPSEFFPVSGNYTSAGGVAGLDRTRERFFAHSLSDRTHGAWVFDGDRSSWIGFVAAPDATNKFFGVDPATGKHYMGGGSHVEGTGYINITDGSATPVPQGRLYEDFRSDTAWAREAEGSLSIDSNILIDAPTGRLFAQYLSTTPETVRGVLVLRDTTPPITPRISLDLDELTHDLPDDQARLEFSANASGFGAQYVQVGGWENVWSRPGAPTSSASNFMDPVLEQNSNPASIRYGNRGATMSLVEQIGIASSGSSASAITTRPDDNTPADAETKQNEAENEANEATDGGVDDLSAAVEDASSDDEDVQEARYVTCLDGNGETVTNEQGSEEEPAHAVVVCDLDNLETTAYARFSGGSGGGGVVVSDSSFDGRTYRDPDRGIVTETEAIAEGIFFGEADLGGFSIDRVTSTATTWAKGLDGESHVRWVRTVEGMRMIDADGTASEETSCTTIAESGKELVEEGDCKARAEDLNELMPNRFEVRFPRPEIVATPGGAFASVQENETDFLSGQATNNDQRRMVPGMEMTVFADGPQRGRLWVQLAAVKADATFIRSPLPPPFDDSTGGADTVTNDAGGTTALAATGEGETGEFEAPDSGGTTVASPVTTDEPEVADADSMTIASHQERLIGGFGWLPALRSLGDAVLTGALYLVFLLPIAEIVRRRRLLGVLTDSSPADASSLSTARSPARVSGSPVTVSGSPVGSTS